MRTISRAGRTGRLGVFPSHGAGIGARQSRGQSLTEFALIAPLFLFLLLIAVDAGRLFFSWIAVDNAAREGAAYAAANPTDTNGISAHALQEANVQQQAGENPLSVTSYCADPGGSAIDCSTAAGGGGTGNRVTVSVNEPFSFFTPLINGFLGNSVTLNGTETAAVFVLGANGGGGAPAPCQPPDSAAFGVSAVGLVISVDASASTPNSGPCAIAGYSWDWGDGVNAFPPLVGKQVTYTYAAAGTYSITLTVTNQAGSKSITSPVSVQLPDPSASPSPSPTPSPTPAPSPSIVCNMAPSFTYTEAGHSGKFNFFGAYTGQPAPANWTWTYGDGNVASGQAPSQHRYSGSGPYSVTLSVTSGICQSSTSQSVTP